MNLLIEIHERLLGFYNFLPSVAPYEHLHSGGQSWQSNHGRIWKS